MPYKSTKGHNNYLFFLVPPNHIYIYPNLFYVDVVDCNFLARYSDKWFAVVKRLLEYSCVIRDKESFGKTEVL